MATVLSVPRGSSSRPFRTVAFVGVIVIGSVLIGLLSFEVYHRYVLYSKILKITDEAVLWIQDQTLNRRDFDDFFGRKTEEIPKGLFKINTTFNIAVAHPTQGVLNFSVRSNNLGLLSDKAYEFERNPKRSEYRIVMLGDSMTGPTTATYQWVDTVEDLLNSNRALREKVGGKEFRVYNLGWVAAGFQTFWKAYEKSGQYFSPDMIVVNFIEVDFPRTDGAHIKDEDEMVEHAKSHLEKIVAAQPNLVLTLMPIYNDMLPTFVEFKLTAKLAQAMLGVKIEIMRDRLPTQLGQPEIENWFNVPHDAHLSDRGGEVYARAMAGVIVERIAAAKVEFSNVSSKYSKEVLESGTPRTRKITTAISHIADDSAKVVKIKRYILEEMLAGKVYTLYPYSLNALLGYGTDGVTIPYTKKLHQGYVKVPTGSGPDDVAYLSVACLSEKYSLRNPGCFHHFHMFVR
jgi:hypothetical protein